MNSPIGRRLFAIFGILWNVTILTILLLQHNVPILWKFSWTLFGGWVLVAMAATLMGKDDDWAKGLRRAQLIAFMIAVLLALIGTTQFR
jgi:hypothetical protein